MRLTWERNVFLNKRTTHWVINRMLWKSTVIIKSVKNGQKNSKTRSSLLPKRYSTNFLEQFFFYEFPVFRIWAEVNKLIVFSTKLDAISVGSTQHHLNHEPTALLHPFPHFNIFQHFLLKQDHPCFTKWQLLFLSLLLTATAWEFLELNSQSFQLFQKTLNKVSLK